mmetsp:Transcript_10216/g.23144  ORF Transcript_10216/g.23144 Transcript_10216/m.23144 type:complete len:133 (+) Transcript_10216:2-400(+)
MSECNLGPTGAALLAGYIRSPSNILQELSAYRAGLGADGVKDIVQAAAFSSHMHSLNLTANAQHGSSWAQTVGQALAAVLSKAEGLKVVRVSCPEAEIGKAQPLFDGLPTRVILVPNEQNNYNRTMFLGHVH